MSQLETSTVPAGFTEATARANGITINYVRGGSGPTLVLLHGYPQTWYMWRKIMPALGEHHTVIAPDLRGSGGSDAPERGYDKATLAEDVHQLLAGLGLADQVNVVGHDIGMTVAYAYAAAHRSEVIKLVLMDSRRCSMMGSTSYRRSPPRVRACGTSASSPWITACPNR
jgi:pimeloyl-ACP methyl ester carboxylesterase